jgi:hypothetical protein
MRYLRFDVTASNYFPFYFQPFGSASKFGVIGWSSSVKCQASIEIPSEVDKSQELLDVMTASGPATTLNFFSRGSAFNCHDIKMIVIKMIVSNIPWVARKSLLLAVQRAPPP